MKIYIVGIGVDGVKTLTREAEEAIASADVLIGAKRMLDPFLALGKPFLTEYRSTEIVRYLNENSFGMAALLMSGDCGFFSGAKKLAELLDDHDTEVISGISSPVYLCAKLKKEWSDCFFVSLHGQDGNIARHVKAHEKTFFLLGGDLKASDICGRLCEYGMDDVVVYIGERLGYDNERIITGKACELIDFETDGLCVMLAENRDCEKALPCGISDDEFIRGKVPMTKSEIRTLVAVGLDIGKNDTCWDIGGGTGSVSVEMAVRCENGIVCTVEKNPEAVGLIRQNQRKFGCDNIRVLEGKAEELVNDLPAPDCVFIGGSGGMLEEIIAAAIGKNSSARLIVTAVSLETLSECIALFDKFGLEADISQIAVTRTKKIGQHTMLSAENPVYIIKRKLQ
ncbi:MAG: precorrin-6y C5,15-methyltransferase (decarboxylating) subunit CbiE [Ruminococcus sp.]|uniref:precorrin-6y C5,15-methyltransferase (decarboxylating) subunit CbiE n=1 Tax=Ruminococcus sp. TaxID=41978 RepID=UPI0025F24B62|nr:precorrin-6y C5,15-methyltransferase (decarboxylating) subunit CbiE [Ruminococcus sp.]MCR5600911.1 precorrin-6y C5,15-methyltransferase (decarboxylating) subunit CbiE [Ruminococcus sp.]